MIELRTLGTLAFTADDGSATPSAVLAQPRRMALLCYLAIMSPRGFPSRDTLHALFWPEHDTERARHALRQALYFLRHHLGSDAIVSRGVGRVGMSDRIRCDAARFEALLHAGKPEDALAIYADPLLPGFHLDGAPDFERWLETERSRFRRRAAEAAWGLADSEDRARNPEASTEWARRAVELSPADEVALRRLLLLLDRLGNRATALRAYETFARDLEREYELHPSAETMALVARLQAGGRRPAPPQSAPAAAVAGFAAPIGYRPDDAPAGTIAPASRRPARRRTIHPAAIALTVGTLLVAAAWVGLGRRDVAGGEIERGGARPAALRSASADDASGAPSPMADVAMYELYRRGSDRVRLRSDSAAREGIELLQRAIARDSTYAPAWAALALMRHRVGLTLPPFVRRRHWDAAERAARTAIALDDSLAEGHVMLGKLRLAAFDFATAERELAKAIRLNSRSPEPHELLVTLHLWKDQPLDALAHAERAIRLDPLSPAAHAERARALLGLDRCDQALATLDSLTALDPPLLRAADIATYCHARRGTWSEAIALHQHGAERGLSPALAQTAYVLARAGRRSEALRIRAALTEAWKRGDEGAFNVALVHAALGDVDEALRWLDRAVTDGSFNGTTPGHHLIMLPGPLSDGLHRHPGFARLRQRLGLTRL
ncbi:MAG TPA: BTAD domain-containing putative transcriptional regulator [Gemmatimonadaceae bacterium]|nr:BTAD domain-containing putative transcriptional regulator [Gemmatimonadaceae bacterium]